MIDLYFWPTPNCRKVSILLEECGLPYRLRPVNITAGAQFSPEFRSVSPNSRVPAIVDPFGPGGAPITIFESGAILLYLADKTGMLIPSDPRGRVEVTKWLFWQVSGLGPMSGQAQHFRRYAPELLPYAVDRYEREVKRLYGVLERALTERPFLAGEYSIADIACWPWVARFEWVGQDLSVFPAVTRWYEEIARRPGVARGRVAGEGLLKEAAPPDEAHAILFGPARGAPDREGT